MSGERGMWIDADLARLFLRFTKPNNVHIPPLPEEEEKLLASFRGAGAEDRQRGGARMKGVEVSEDGEFLRVRKKDSKRAVSRYSRELMICPAINPGGVHLSVTIALPGARPTGTGLNLSPKQARRVIKHMQQILDALEQQ